MEGNKIVRILAMSDTHSLNHKIDISKLPAADIFIHAGDFTKYSLEKQLKQFRQFLTRLPYKHKVVIAGNHDFALDKVNYQDRLRQKHLAYKQVLDSDEQIRKMKEVCTYLHHEMIQIMGVKIFGSPFQPQFCDWGFMYSEKDGQQVWSNLPSKIDVLITHGPPYGILDRTVSKQNAGCKALLKLIQRIKPQVHIFGHIHEGYGQCEVDGVRYYNASNVNFNYKYVNPPFLIQVQVRQ